MYPYHGLSSKSLQADDSTITRLQADVNYLCSPPLEGRDVPGKGGDIACDWLGESFTEIGLAHGTADFGYFQEFQLIQSTIDTSLTKLTFFFADKKVTLKWGSDFLIFPRKIANYKSKLDVAYAHYGIHADELNRDDFGEKTRDKVALVLNGSGVLPPQRADRHGMTPFKAVAAKRAGAKNMVVLHTEEDGAWPPEALLRKLNDSKLLLTDLPDSKQDFLTIHINGTLLNGQQDVVSSLSRDIFKALTSGSTRANVRLKTNLVFKKPENHIGRNVIGLIEGKTDQYIIIGAHYDHIGIDGKSEKGTLSYYPGADDNASGISVLLEISRIWKLREQPKIGMILVAFGAEEDGMLGSKFFANNLPEAKSKIVAMINLDMVGRNGYSSMREVRLGNSDPDPDYVALYCSAASAALLNIAKGTGFKAGLNTDIKPINRFSFSDAGSFHAIDIPTISIFGGFHKDYSQLSDTPEFINWTKLAKMVLLTDNLLINFNTTTENIIFDNTLKVKKHKLKY